MPTGAEPAPLPGTMGGAGPDPFHPDELDIYLRRHERGTGAMYLSLLGLLVILLIAVPLVRVPTAVRATGFLRPSADSHSLTTGTAGEVVQVRSRVDARVSAGDTIVLISRPELTARAAELAARRAVLVGEIGDLTSLLAASERLDPTGRMGSLRYAREWQEYRTSDEALRRREAAALRALQRSSALLERGLVASSDHEQAGDELSQLQNERLLARMRADARWRAELASALAELRRADTEDSVLAAEMEQLAIVSPVDGTIDRLSGISPGSLLRAGEVLGTITPASALVAELYVDAADLGAITLGAPARLRLASYRFSGWGLVTGEVIEIAPALTRVGDRAMGRIRVKPTVAPAAGPSGRAGLRRGVSVSARIPTGPTTLWGLLRNRRSELNGEPPVPIPDRTPQAG